MGQTTGNIIDYVGTALNLPEWGISERVAGYQPTTFTGNKDTQSGGDLEAWRTQNFVVGSGTPNPSPSSGDVLGDQTTNTSSGGGGNTGGSSSSTTNTGFNTNDPNANPGDGWFWDAADGWKRSDGGNTSTGLSADALNAAFNPVFNALAQAESAVRGNYDADVRGVGKRYGVYNEQYDTEKKKLTQDTKDRQSDFNQTLKSALDDAVRAYNALNQQRIARFGGGSSAGEAVGELARQEFFRQQGNVQQEGVRGEREFNKEFANINQFIAQKKSELDLWKEDALSELKKNLNTQLANIQAQRGETESAKAQARLSIIQDSVNRARAIEDQDRSFRQQLAIAGVNQLQESAGRTFTPEEIQATIQQFMGGNTGIGASQATAGVDPRSLALYNPNTQTNNDEISKLQGLT